MRQISDYTNFQIILKSDNKDDLSDYWQEQCRYLYDEIVLALPEGSIKPSTRESMVGEKALETVMPNFSEMLVSHIAAEIFLTVVFDAIRRWHQHRPDADVHLFGKRPGEEMSEITNQLPE
jgi:hypothetical protein